jgi:hypothetical protein
VPVINQTRPDWWEGGSMGLLTALTHASDVSYTYKLAIPRSGKYPTNPVDSRLIVPGNPTL